jgi:hypothetical protein
VVVQFDGALVRLRGAYSVGTRQHPCALASRYPSCGLTHKAQSDAVPSSTHTHTHTRRHTQTHTPLVPIPIEAKKRSVACGTVQSDSRQAMPVSSRVDCAVGMPSKPALPATSPLHRPDVLATSALLALPNNRQTSRSPGGRQSALIVFDSTARAPTLLGSLPPSPAIYESASTR